MTRVAEITRDETAERARLLRVRSYDIELDLTGGPGTFRSTSVISFDCAEPGAASYADLIAETVHEITLNGAAVDPATAWQAGRIALAGLAARNELRVVADCAYGTGGVGLQRSADSADGRIYTFTQLAAAHARRVFANFEQPDLKATFAFHLTVPRHWTVLSNQPAPEPEPAGDEAAVWHFEPTPRISTYLTAIAAGEYHLVRESHTTPDGQVIPLALACRQSMLGYLETEELLGITRQGLDYFTGLFGTAYPFAKFDQVFVPDNAGAMENAGCVIITEQLLFRSKVTGTMRELRAYVILHEMAHQWFGDLVTMRWWEDLWLNESFATLLGFQAAAEATRFTSSWTTFCGRKAGAYLLDQQPSAHPIAADVATLSAAEANFDAISYDKGAAVLKQLVAYTGRDSFFAGIRAYFAEHGGQNATLADLLTALAASSGRNLADWSRAWLETAGPNTLRPELSVGPDGTFSSFAVRQHAPAAHPALRPHHLAIGLYNRLAGGALVRTYRVETDLAGPRTEVPGLVGRAQPDLVLLNDDDLDYAIVRFDERSLATLTESIGRFDDDLARTICWNAVTDMASQAELSVPAFVRMVAAGMGRERSVSVLENVHKTTSRLLGRTADPAYVPEGTALLAAEGIALLRAAEPGSDLQLAWARLLGWTATTPVSSTSPPGCSTAARRYPAWRSTPGCGGGCCSGWPPPAGPATRRSTPSWPATPPTPAAVSRWAAGRGSPTPSTRRRRGGWSPSRPALAWRTRSRSPGRSTWPSTRTCSRRTQRSTSPSCRPSGRPGPDGCGCCSPASCSRTRRHRPGCWTGSRSSWPARTSTRRSPG